MRPFFYRYGANCCAKQVDTTKGYPKIDLFAFKGNDRVLHIGWSYRVGPKVNMRLFWIAYDCTLSDFLYFQCRKRPKYVLLELARYKIKFIVCPTQQF